jgi:putative ABC transport system substrate-binding protein
VAFAASADIASIHTPIHPAETAMRSNLRQRVVIGAVSRLAAPLLARAVLVLCLLLSLAMAGSARDSCAQQPGRAYRIGVVGPGNEAYYASRMNALREALRQLGWIEGTSFVFVNRFAGRNYDQLPRLAAALVAQNVELILAVGGTRSIDAAMKATKQIPIVFTTVGDPVAQKLVVSMARPGGNVTGVSNMNTELYAKQLELLAEALPGIRRVGRLSHKGTVIPEVLRGIREVGRKLGIQIDDFEVRDAEDYEGAFDSMARAGAQGVLVASDVMFNDDLPKLGALALQYKLPLVADFESAGVFMTYNRDVEENFRRAAFYIDKIFKGANPAELPIEQPTKVRLTVNLKTAKALGLRIAPSVVLRADDVIQ